MLRNLSKKSSPCNSNFTERNKGLIEKSRTKILEKDPPWFVSKPPFCLLPPTGRLSQNFHSDEGLTLVTSAFKIFHGGDSSFINSFDETKFSYLK